MFLELLIFSALVDSNDNYAKLIRSAKKNANGSMPGAGLLFFEQIDYIYSQSGFLFPKITEIKKKISKTSIPINSIKSVVEVEAKKLYNSEYNLKPYVNRVGYFHKGSVLIITTFSGKRYIIDCTFKQFHSKLKNLQMRG